MGLVAHAVNGVFCNGGAVWWQCCRRDRRGMSCGLWLGAGFRSDVRRPNAAEGSKCW